MGKKVQKKACKVETVVEVLEPEKEEMNTLKLLETQKEKTGKYTFFTYGSDEYTAIAGVSPVDVIEALIKMEGVDSVMGEIYCINKVETDTLPEIKRYSKEDSLFEFDPEWKPTSTKRSIEFKFKKFELLTINPADIEDFIMDCNYTERLISCKIKLIDTEDSGGPSVYQMMVDLAKSISVIKLMKKVHPKKSIAFNSKEYGVKFRITYGKKTEKIIRKTSKKKKKDM